MLLSELLVLLLSAGGVDAVASTWANSTTLTVYRVTPIGVPGLTNMNTADAAGDVYFGLFQLALPLLCAQPGMATNMGWCTNRKWLSGGRHMMVYRQFKLEARFPLGIYARCNPDEKTGTFSCCSSRQPRCGSPDFVPPTPGECDDCCWWQPPTRSSGGSPYESPPALNVTFAPYCDRARCNCPAIDTLSVGWEPHAMCNKPMAAEFHRRAARHAARRSDAIGGLLLHEQPTPSYWSCNGAVSDKCGGWTAYEDPGCRQCAATHLAQGDPRFKGNCNLALIDKVCTPPAFACAQTIRKDCGAEVGNGNCSRGNTTQCKLCENCAFGGEARAALIAANCSFDVLFGTCGEAHHGQPIMFQWMNAFACLMSGNWYSTQAAGRCNSSVVGSDDDSCWWKLRSPERGSRVVNASCADGRVVAAVRDRYPSCWEGCPVEERENATAPCPVHCLFNVVLGNASMGLKPMTRQELVAPFEAAFAPMQQGGCPGATQ